MSNTEDAKTMTGTDGSFQRKPVTFRDWIKADGSTKFAPEKGRYHLYVSYACPWANRVLIVRKLKGLEDVIDVSVVDWFMGDKGWSFDSSKDGCTEDSVNGFKYLRELYFAVQPNYTGRFTVPVLYDKKLKTIVNNESSELIRMLNTEFNEFCATQEQRDLDIYPEALREEIDAVNEWVYPNINNGVYRCGFARTQEAYDKAVKDLFAHLDKAEERLSDGRKYLVGGTLTEADIRLFVTLIRFDIVYFVHFKCNVRHIHEYPHLQRHTQRLYANERIRSTVNFDHIKNHYYQSHESINPCRIVPAGPDMAEIGFPTNPKSSCGCCSSGLASRAAVWVGLLTAGLGAFFLFRSKPGTSPAQR